MSWTGTANATVAHGLNAAPQLVITKSRQYGTAWRIWSAYLTSPSDRYLGFDAGAESTYGAYWGSMTSTTLGFPSVLDNNYGDMIAYCFAPVAGYSAMGSYSGNGAANGPFVFTGFRPAVIILKRTDSGGSWQIRDTSRSPLNVVTENLYPNLSNAESTDSSLNLDILSNGFKLRTSTDGGSNASGGTYIYYAVAENPFKSSRAR